MNESRGLPLEEAARPPEGVRCHGIAVKRRDESAMALKNTLRQQSFTFSLSHSSTRRIAAILTTPRRRHADTNECRRYHSR